MTIHSSLKMNLSPFQPHQMYPPEKKKMNTTVHYKCSTENLYEDFREKEIDNCSVRSLSPPPLLVSRVAADALHPQRKRKTCSRCLEPILIIWIACVLSVAVIMSLLMTGFLDRKSESSV